MLSVLVLSRLVHAALQGRACRQLLPTRRRQCGLRETFLERWIRQDAARDIDCDAVHHLRQSLAAFDVEAVLQLGDASRGVNLLHATIVLVDGLYGSEGCRFAQDHIDGLHADAAVGDVRGGETDGHDDVACLALLWRHGTIGDIVRPFRQVSLHVALVLHLSVDNVASAVVRVHRVGAPSNRVVRLLVLQAVVLRHHHSANHSACLAYVELWREVLVVLVLVEWIAPQVELVPDVLRHARVGPKDVEEALGVVLVELGDGVALLVGCLGIVPTVANHVGREGTVIVVVCLHGVPRVRSRGVLHICPLQAVTVAAPSFLLHPSEQQFVLRGVVIVRHLRSDGTEGLRLRQRQAVVVGLDVVIARAFGGHRVAHDAPQQSTRRVARHNVWVHTVAELMLVQALRSVLRLAILRRCFTSDGIGDACPSHEVALVTAIHEDLGTDRPLRRHLGVRAVFQRDALHLVAFLLSAHDAPLVPNVDAVLQADLRQESLEGGEGNLRFEVERWRGHAVMLTDAAVELACKAFDDAAMTCAVTNVGPAQSACRQATDALRRRHEQHALSFQLGRIGRHDACRRTAIDADINILHCALSLVGSDVLRGHEAHCHKQKCAKESLSFHRYLGVFICLTTLKNVYFRCKDSIK